MANRTKTEAILVHHTAGNEANMDVLRSVFKSRFKVNYVGYNLVIFPDGSVASDIGDDGFGIHNATGKYTNANAVGISLVGNYSHARPSDNVLSVLEHELERLRAKYGLGRDRVFGHRDFKSTACPGAKLYEWLEGYKKGDDVELAVRSVAAVLRRVKFFFENGKEPDMDSINPESRQVVNFVLQKGDMKDPYDLVGGWYKKDIKAVLDANKKEIRALQKQIDKLENRTWSQLIGEGIRNLFNKEDSK